MKRSRPILTEYILEGSSSPKLSVHSLSPVPTIRKTILVKSPTKLDTANAMSENTIPETSPAINAPGATVNPTTVEIPPRIEVTAHRMTDEPTNEFEQNNILYLQGYPHLFPLGEGMPFTGSIPKKYHRHLLLQRNGAFASDPTILFTMMNQLQRHANIRAVSCMAESSPEAVAEIGRLQTDVDFIAKTKYASENPNSKEAKEVRLKLQNVIQTTGKNVPYSPSERAEATTTLLTMSQIFGPPNIFMTMSMDDAHTALTLRMSFPSSKQAANLLFPATDSGFSEALFEGQDMFTDSIPITDAKLFERMNQNPVAAAEYF
jgi:hypothetical protein